MRRAIIMKAVGKFFPPESYSHRFLQKRSPIDFQFCKEVSSFMLPERYLLAKCMEKYDFVVYRLQNCSIETANGPFPMQAPLRLHFLYRCKDTLLIHALQVRLIHLLN